MHEDEVQKQLEQFEEDARKEGKLKVPLSFSGSESPIRYNGTEIDIKPEFIKKDKKRAIEITRKKDKDFFNLGDGEG